MNMVKRRLMFTFPGDLIKEPLIYNLGKQFKIITNIRRADVSDDKGWAILELEGEENDIERGVDWISKKGVRVDPASGDMMEG